MINAKASLNMTSHSVLSVAAVSDHIIAVAYTGDVKVRFYDLSLSKIVQTLAPPISLKVRAFESR